MSGAMTEPATLEIVVTYLEMLKPPTRPTVPAPPVGKIALLRAERPTVSYYRYLYNTVGEPWLWWERRLLSDAELERIILDPLVEIYVLYVDGVPAGYAELDRRKEEDVELAYFGLIPQFIGRKLGLGDGNRIVVYDAHGMMSAARVWWTFRVMGHKDVAVLDGGLPKWLAEGRPVEDTPPPPRERHFSARLNHTLVKDKAAIARNLRNTRFQVLDARSAGRFQGTEPEPWPGRRSGHIPGSRNLPFTELLDPKDKTFLPADALAAKLEAAGIDLKKPVATSCGSGVTAAILALGLHLIGHEHVAVYDGSWAEWGLPGDTPVETGPA